MNEFGAWPIVNIINVSYSHYSIFDRSLPFLSISINFSGYKTVSLTTDTILYSRSVELTHFAQLKIYTCRTTAVDFPLSPVPGHH